MSASPTSWLRGLLMAICLLACMSAAAQIQPYAQQQVLRFEQADFQLTQTQLPPKFNTNWQHITLPDNWNVSLPGQGGHGWYRFQFSLDTIPETQQAIYFARASMNATVFLNGVLIDNSGGLYESGVRNWNRPFLIQFLSRHLQPGNNELLIRVDASADDMGGLSPVELGPVDQLAPTYQQRRLIQLVIPQISEVFVGLMCLLTFGFWLLLRDPLYGYFALASGAYFIREIEYSFHASSISAGWIQMGVATLVGWFVIFMALFSMRLLQLHWARLEKHLLALAGMFGLLLLALGGSSWAASVAIGLHVTALVLGLVTLGLLLPKVGRVPYLESLPLAGAGLFTLALGVHDVLQRVGVISTMTPRLSHLGVPVLIFTMSSILFSRYVKNIKLLEQTNRNLERQVTQKSAQLVETLHNQLRLQKHQAVSQERELILREMHDGVGNYLTIALRAAARPMPDMPLLNSALKNCMLDLRLMIDSLGESESGADTVATVLGNLRYRIEPALKSEGIELIWEVEEVEIFNALTPRNVLNLTRIFQEALTNVIKHAHATQVVLRSGMVVHEGRRYAVITVSDNGRWMMPADITSYGQDNMRRRADQLEGQLLVKRSSAGSTVELSLPEERRSRSREPPVSDAVS